MRALALLLVLAADPSGAQDTLRLAEVREDAVRRDPRARHAALEEEAAALRLRTLDAGRLPQLRASGEAAYQSEVAAVPLRIPGAEIPVPPKDRYEAALHAEWLLYDGGALQARRALERAGLATAHAEIDAALHPLRAEATTAFFAALLLQDRLEESAALLEALEARLAEVRAGVRAGAALPGDTAVLRAELLRAGQQRDALRAERRALLAVLGDLTGRTLSGGEVLALPDLAPQVAEVRAAVRGEDAAGPLREHPAYAVFAARRRALEREAALVGTRAMPQASAFGQLAYGRPGPAQFEEGPHPYWRAGVQVRWAPWDWGTAARERESLRIRREIVEGEEAALTRRLLRAAEAPLHEMERLREALESDDRIVALRAQVERQARAQLRERAITPAAYVAVRTDLQEARIARLRHRAELQRAAAEYLSTLGVEPR